jgi:type IV secretory pathway VirJ component
MLFRPAIFGLLACMVLGVNALAAELAPPTIVGSSTLDGGKFGTLTIYRPKGEIKSVVLFLSGDGGWHLGVIDAAQRFVQEGALVIGIDVRSYLAAIKPRDTAANTQRCVSLAGDFEYLSHYVQRALNLDVYQEPTLVGYSSGATIVYAALAEAPRGTFRAAVSMGFCPDQTFNGASPCKVYGLAYRVERKPKSADKLIFEANPELKDPWIIAQGERDQVCDAATTRNFVAAVPSAQWLDLPRVGHGFSVTANWWPQLQSAYAALPPATLRIAIAADSDISKLPVFEVPATGARSGNMALLITGDGGWAGLDQDLATELAAAGVPVAALSSVKYFWHARTPEQTAADVAKLLRHYLLKWQAARVLLVGYSFGADVMPFVLARLPQDLRERVASMSLLGPSPAATFEISVAGWIPGITVKGLPTLPELQGLSELPELRGLPILCVQGSAEHDSLCPRLKSPGTRVMAIGSGHHFGGDVKDIAAAMLALPPAAAE